MRLWSLETHEELSMYPLSGPARACAYSPDGTMIAVGFGSGASGKEKKTVDGKVCVFSIDKNGELIMSNEAKDAREWISDIKFTPDGKTLAVGSHDNSVYLYSTFQKFKKRAKFSKHNSYITHFDISNDSHYMQSNCGAYELLFSDVLTGKQISSSSSLKDVQWSSWTCTLGWPVQGIWPPNTDGTDINAVDRSRDGKLIATADDFGKVKLFRYPCLTQNAQAHVSVGHSSHVTNARWSAKDMYLVTLGGNDRCVFAWRHITGNEGDSAGPQSRKRQKQMAADNEAVKQTLVDDGLVPHEKENPPTNNMATTDPDELIEAPMGGDEFMAVKPWLGAIIEPSKPNKLEELKWELDSQLKAVLKKQATIRRGSFTPDQLKKLQVRFFFPKDTTLVSSKA